jgi:hypothetical protein
MAIAILLILTAMFITMVAALGAVGPPTRAYGLLAGLARSFTFWRHYRTAAARQKARKVSPALKSHPTGSRADRGSLSWWRF